MVNRRQLLKISALGTASFAAPLAYSASNITIAYNTGNPIGSTSPKDLADNARNLDYLVNGENASYLDRKGVPCKSWKGMEGEHNADQIRRESEFDVDQVERVVVFNQYLKSSGFETPVDYAPGIRISRTTQIVRFLGELYRPKDNVIPFVTTTFAADEVKWISNGDNSLRQNLANKTDPLKGAAEIGAIADVPGAVGTYLSNRIFKKLYPSDFEGVDITGATDSFAGMKKWLNSGRPVLEMDPGATYLLSDTLPLPESVDEIIGNKAKVIYTKKQVATDIAVFQNLNRTNSLFLHDFSLEYTGTFDKGPTGGHVHGIDIGTTSGMSGLTIHNVNATRFNRNGIAIGRIGAIDNPLTVIKGVVVYNCNASRNRVAGIWYGWVDGIALLANQCHFNGLAGDNSTGYGMSAASDAYAKNVHADLNFCNDNYRKGMDWHSGFNVTCTHNTALRNAIQGIALVLRNNGNGAFPLQPYGTLIVSENTVGDMGGGISRAYGIYLACDIDASTPFPVGSEFWRTKVIVSKNVVTSVSSLDFANIGIGVAMLSAANLDLLIDGNVTDIGSTAFAFTLNAGEPVHPQHRNKIKISNHIGRWSAVTSAFIGVDAANRVLMDITIDSSDFTVSVCPKSSDGVSASPLFSDMKTVVMRRCHVQLDAVHFNTAMWGSAFNRLTICTDNLLNGAPYSDFTAARRVSAGSGIPCNREFWELGSYVDNSVSTGAAGTALGWRCSTAGFAISQLWTAGTIYPTGTRVSSGSVVLVATSGGTSGRTAPIGPGVDGSVLWDNILTPAGCVGIRAVFTPVNN